MKKLIVIAACMLSAATFAQDKQVMEQRARELSELTKTNQFAKILDYSHPRLFDYATREQMLELMNNMMKGPGFAITMLDVPQNFAFGNILNHGGTSYSVIHYDMGLKLAFDAPIPDAQRETQLAAMKTAMKTENVVYDAKANAIVVKKRAEMIAVYGPETKNQWAYVNNDGGMLIKVLIPEEVRSQLKIQE